MPRKQQCRADDRAGDLRLDDPSMRPGEDEEGQYQFGGVAEADVEQSADGAAGALGKLVGGAAKPIASTAMAAAPVRKTQAGGASTM
jgi:hypothetical protein